MEKLRAELDELTNVRRPDIAARIHEAKAHGDLSENAEYEDAKNEQAFVEGRIQQLEALIKNAILIDENHATDHVSIGSTVGLKSTDGKEAYTIVGPAEAAPREGRISNESPLGRMLLGRKVGESVTVNAPDGETVYTITKIS
jgi:transcription elongation factor GreA